MSSAHEQLLDEARRFGLRSACRGASAGASDARPAGTTGVRSAPVAARRAERRQLARAPVAFCRIQRADRALRRMRAGGTRCRAVVLIDQRLRRAASVIIAPGASPR
jgi:hypothetical protein